METTPLLQAPAEILGQVAPAQLAPLVSESVRDRWIALARRFAIPVRTACYECHLGPDDRRVDLALCIMPTILWNESELLAAWTWIDPEHATWGQIARFLESWCRPGSELLVRVPFVWIAFDFDDGRSLFPVPSVGLCVDPQFFARKLGIQGPTVSPGSLMDLADTGARMLFGTPLLTTTRDALARCVSMQDQGVWPRHLSFMNSRSPASFKIDVRLPVDRIGRFLDHIDWNCSGRSTEAAIRDLLPDAEQVQINLVLDEDLDSPLEVEYTTDPKNGSSAERRTLLENLVKLGVCARNKAEVLLDILDRPLEEETGSSARMSRAWYLKVRFMNATASHAKAYVGLTPSWSRHRGRSMHDAP